MYILCCKVCIFKTRLNFDSFAIYPRINKDQNLYLHKMTARTYVTLLALGLFMYRVNRAVARTLIGGCLFALHVFV